MLRSEIDKLMGIERDRYGRQLPRNHQNRRRRPRRRVEHQERLPGSPTFHERKALRTLRFWARHGQKGQP